MTWNYRVIRKTLKTIHYYNIHEVYYNKAKKITGWTKTPVGADGSESIKDLRLTLSMMLCDSLKFPILEIVGKKKKKLVERKNAH